jgi:murein DD-endopeptidase MepM/ murein hydrolase activator NlpD
MKAKKRRYFFLIAVVAAACAAYVVLSAEDPQISGYEGFARLPQSEIITLTVGHDRPIDRFEVEVLQGLRHVTLVNDRNVGTEKTYALHIEPRALRLTDGEATVLLTAESGLFGKTRIKVAARVDMVPPAIKQITSTRFVRQGSAGAVKVRAVGAERVYVKIGDEKFPLSKSREGEKNVYSSLFAVGSDVPPDTDIFVVAEDDNENVRHALTDTTITRAVFKKENIEVSDRFLEEHVYPSLGAKGGGISAAEAIRRVNETWRKEDGSFIRELSRDTADEPLWHGRFLQMSGSKVFATYGERRKMYYHGEQVSACRHLGYDLASVRHAPVVAANSGRVVYAGVRKIYGKTVIIDHGLGLMSLYGHLSEVSVSEGQTVSKGDLIGRTGSTGFAMGDHLHFAILVHGVPVNPLNWWDGKWIENRILYFLS